MKRVFLIIIVCFLSLTMFSCSSSDQKKPENNITQNTTDNGPAKEEHTETDDTDTNIDTADENYPEQEQETDFEPLEIQEEYDVGDDIGDDDGLEGAVG